MPAKRTSNAAKGRAGAKSGSNGGRRGAASTRLVGTVQGDILGILDAGAYGFSMSSSYTQRCRCAEVLIDAEGKARLIRRRETPEDLARCYTVELVLIAFTVCLGGGEPPRSAVDVRKAPLSPNGHGPAGRPSGRA